VPKRQAGNANLISFAVGNTPPNRDLTLHRLAAKWAAQQGIVTARAER